MFTHTYKTHMYIYIYIYVHSTYTYIYIYIFNHLLCDQLPNFVVLKQGGKYHAITGNRRLWVLREFARIIYRSMYVRCDYPS